jgi:hypothetical protein
VIVFDFWICGSLGLPVDVRTVVDRFTLTGRMEDEQRLLGGVATTVICTDVDF